MSPKVQSVFYLLALVCFVLAAFESRVGTGRGRAFTAGVGLVPLGLALWLFPTFWTTAKVAFGF
jgi:hypothetical protein